MAAIKPWPKQGVIDPVIDRFYIWLRARLLKLFLSPANRTSKRSPEVDVDEHEDFRQRLAERYKVKRDTGGR